MARHLSLSWAPIGHRLCHHDEVRPYRRARWAHSIDPLQVQGLGSPGGPENPIWTLAKESQLANTYSNYSSILSYEATGYVDYTEFINNVEDVWVTLDDANNYVFDQRGFNTFIKGEASKFLSDNDPRLLLNTVVRNITYNDTGVTIHNTDGTCISAAHAICTFSPGVLQHAPASVSFHPPLPAWKVAAIDSFQIGTYTKIFLQFNHTFWPTDTQFLLYADPLERGHYPVFQSLFRPGFPAGKQHHLRHGRAAEEPESGAHERWGGAGGGRGGAADDVPARRCAGTNGFSGAQVEQGALGVRELLGLAAWRESGEASESQSECRRVVVRGRGDECGGLWLLAGGVFRGEGGRGAGCGLFAGGGDGGWGEWVSWGGEV
ncbi:hypothetical protein LTR50_002118 [Elasticomyces elasticus]|nr:hypothetical protein LTR50_002118 [Elasticomyces elasticus]